MAFAVYALQRVLQDRYVDFLSSNPFKVWDGEVWRLLTSVLPHANEIHHLFNCYWVWVLGSAAEAHLGSVRYIGLILMLALGSSTVEFFADPAPAIGLSGVGYGLFGYFYSLRLYKDFAARAMQPNVVKAFVGWFFLCIILTSSGFWHVANVAHGAGAAVGWMIGTATLKKRERLYMAGLAAAIIAMTCVVMYMPWNKTYIMYRIYNAQRHGNDDQARYWIHKLADSVRRQYPMARPGDAAPDAANDAID
jgi:GlpG protein